MDADLAFDSLTNLSRLLAAGQSLVRRNRRCLSCPHRGARRSGACIHRRVRRRSAEQWDGPRIASGVQARRTDRCTACRLHSRTCCISRDIRRPQGQELARTPFRRHRHRRIATPGRGHDSCSARRTWWNSRSAGGAATSRWARRGIRGIRAFIAWPAARAAVRRSQSRRDWHPRRSDRTPAARCAFPPRYAD